MHILFASILLLAVFPPRASDEEIFVTIHGVNGNQVTLVKSSTSESASGMGRRGARGRANSSQPIVVTISDEAKITSAMRERRTAEFRVGAELAGGLQNPVFLEMQQPLAARIVTDGERIMELNVITGVSDINQSVTDAGGQTVIAIRPKRPPMKKRR